MPSVRQPRSGSMQFWPRKRSSRKVARARTFPKSEKAKLVGFAGYKVGMTHIQAIETNKFSHNKGMDISIPVTLIECPPLKIASLRLYSKKDNRLMIVNEILLTSDKNLAKSLSLPKKDKQSKLDTIKPEEYEDVRILVYTQPHMTGIGKKKPDVFETGIGGKSNSEKIEFVKQNVGKDIMLESIFGEGDLLDIKTITKGKGFQGPIKRFGISLRQSKSEKSIRNPGSLGGWRGQGHVMWRVAHAGKMGYHQRTEYNKQILKIANPEEVISKGGMLRYGLPRNKVILVKGSVSGNKKRLIVFQKAIRAKKQPMLPTIEKINQDSKQGN